jgi:hypothetical protein
MPNGWSVIKLEPQLSELICREITAALPNPISNYHLFILSDFIKPDLNTSRKAFIVGWIAGGDRPADSYKSCYQKKIRNFAHLLMTPVTK